MSVQRTYSLVRVRDREREEGGERDPLKVKGSELMSVCVERCVSLLALKLEPVMNAC